MNNEKMAQFISKARKEKNMTQKDLAEQLGITDKAVSKWERGLSCPDISLLQKLSDVLGVTVAELLNGEKTEVSSPEMEVMVETTLKYADNATRKVIEKSKGWKYAAIVSIVSLLSIFALFFGNISIESGTVLGIPFLLSLFIWLAIIIGVYLMGKQKIASICVCGFAVFILTYYYSTLTAQPTRSIDTFNGFPVSYIPQYTIVILLFITSVALTIITLLRHKNSFLNSKAFLFTALNITIIIMSLLTITSIINYVELNFLGVDSRFTIFIFITIAMNVVLLAFTARRQIKVMESSKRR